jgi:hypothetical protein
MFAPVYLQAPSGSGSCATQIIYNQFVVTMLEEMDEDIDFLRKL